MKIFSLSKRNVFLVLALYFTFSFGCIRVRLAQHIEQVKTNYDRGNFARVLGYARGGRSLNSSNPYDPPGNFTVHEVRSQVVKGTGSPDYDYRHLFESAVAAKVSVEKQDYLRQLALIELRALIHQYFSTNAPPYRAAAQHQFVRRARFLLGKLTQQDFQRPWEKAEILASQGDLAVLDGQYEAAQVAYSLILANPKDLSDEVLGRYSKRYILSLERALSTDTVSKDPTQARILDEEFEANLRKIAELIPNQPVGMYAQTRLLAISQKPLPALINALLSWRLSSDEELRNLLDQFIELRLEDYWPLMKSDSSFKKLILDQWNANKQSTSPR